MLVNGSPEGFFAASRGLRQGDPLSPFLFIIMAEALGHSLENARTSWVDGIQVTSSLPSIAHQQFANDTMLFGSASAREARRLKGILDKYFLASG